MLLNEIAEQAYTKELAKYTHEAQAHCQTQCEENILQEQEALESSGQMLPRDPEEAAKTMSELPEGVQPGAAMVMTQDSIIAMEKQCNKMCLHKMM